MKRIAISIVLFAVLLELPSRALAQPIKPGGSGIRTTTRLVAQFSDLEQQLTQAMQHRDQARLGKLLSADFEEWGPAPPGDPLPREEWMNNALTAITIQSFRLRQMAVRMVGETAVVSFVQSEQAVCNGRDCSGNSFIVDFWQSHNGIAQLLVRYRSNAQDFARQPSPASPPKPTGKD